MTVVDPRDVAGSVRAAGGTARDVIEAETFALFLRHPDTRDLGPTDDEDVPEAWRPWVYGQVRAEDLDWRAILGWEGDDA